MKDEEKTQEKPVTETILTSSTHDLKASELQKPKPRPKKPSSPPADEKKPEGTGGGKTSGDPEFSALKTVPELVDVYNEMVLTAIDLKIRGVANAKTFVDVKTGVLACERLHAQIKKTREAAEGGSGAGKTGKKESTKMAKKAKTAKGGKKAKAAKKGNGARRARLKLDDNAKITWTYPEGNPCREGGGRHERVEKVRKASGKTYKTYLASGGKEGTLSHCVNAGWAKVG